MENVKRSIKGRKRSKDKRYIRKEQGGKINRFD